MVDFNQFLKQTREVKSMELKQDSVIDIDSGNRQLLRSLDRGIDDMEAGRELPLDEAFAKIRELREVRRHA